MKMSRLMGGGTFGALAVVFLLTASASATSTISYGAPYAHWNVSSFPVPYLWGCASQHVTKLKWNATAGIAKVYSKENTRGCQWNGTANADGANFATVDDYLYLTLPLRTFPGTATPTNVTLNWSFSGSNSSSYSMPKGCPSPILNATTGNGSERCGLDAYDAIGFIAWIEDRTNGTTIGSNAPLQELQFETGRSIWAGTVCISFKCSNYSGHIVFGNSFSGSHYQLAYASGILNHAHHYVLRTMVEVLTDAVAQGYPGSHASSMLDLSSGSNGVQLVSVTER